MPELRKDYLTGEWVSIASDRAKRPTVLSGMSGECPFCPQNRHMLPGILYESGEVLAVPNMYPILSEQAGDSCGYHEVIIDTPEHGSSLQNLSSGQIAESFKCIRQRMLHHAENDRIKYIQVFKNNGAEAGASILHPHWQLLAMPFIPPRIEAIIHSAKKYKDEKNECYFCGLIKNAGELKVMENEFFMAYVPYASRFSYEIDIMSKSEKSFTRFGDAELLNLAELLKVSLNALAKTLEKLDFNILFINDESLHFNMQIIPRQGKVAGCELSAGLFANPVYPEDAAEVIRKIIF